MLIYQKVFPGIMIEFVLEQGRIVTEKLRESRRILAKEKEETVSYIKNDLVNNTNLSDAKRAKDKISSAIMETNLKQIKGGITRHISKISKPLRNHIILTAITILISIFFYNENYPESYTLMLFGIYLIVTFTVKMDSRIPIAAALILLIITPFYLIKNLESYANFIATLAYYFLVIGVVKQFVEYLREQKEAPKEKMDEVFGE